MKKYLLAILCLSPYTYACAQTQTEKKKAPETEEKVIYPLLFEPKKEKWEDRSKIIHKDMYNITSVNYGMATGGDRAPLKRYYSLNNEFLKPIIKNRAVYGFAIDAGLFTGPNRNWYASSLNAPADSIYKLKNSVGLGLGVVFAAVLLSEEKIAVTLGPVATARLIFPVGNITARNSTSEIPAMIPFYAGLKAHAYIGKALTITLEYSKGLKRKFTNDEAGPPPTTIPVNYDMLRIGVGYYTFW
jgi:hypothetical protein